MLGQHLELVAQSQAISRDASLSAALWCHRQQKDIKKYVTFPQFLPMFSRSLGESLNQWTPAASPLKP